MELNAAAETFATLGHPGRLSVLRLLLRHAPSPVRPSDIANALDLKRNTLSVYLSALEGSGLVRAKRQGRELHYSVVSEGIATFLAYLADDCCRGRPEICGLNPHTLQGGFPMTKVYNVLFICSGNSARSIFAEALLRDLGGARFNAYSAGINPRSELNPFAIEVLERNGHDVGQMSSKTVETFRTPDAPVFDFVFTVCDAAADEECPPWPGQGLSAHWGLPDPVKAEGSDAEKGLAFANTYSQLHHRIRAFVELPFDQLDQLSLQRRIDALSAPEDASA